MPFLQATLKRAFLSSGSGLICRAVPILLFAVLLPALPVDLFAQANAKIEYFSQSDGLSNHWTFDVGQDSRGFIWISTIDGLNRYDGHAFKVFRPSESMDLPLNADHILWTAELSDGDLLLSTHAGLIRFDPFSEKFSRAAEKQYTRNVFSFSTQPGGSTTWKQAGMTMDYPAGKLSIYREAGKEFQLVGTLLKPDSIDYTLIQYSDAHLWFLSYQGDFYQLDLSTLAWKTFKITGKISNLPIDQQGKCWYVKKGESSLRYFQVPEHIPLHDWSSIHYTDRYIWLLKKGATQAIYRFDPESEQLENVITASGLEIDDHDRFQVYALFEDGNGDLWLPQFQGIVKVQPNQSLFANYLNQPLPTEGIPPIGFSSRMMAEAASGRIYIFNDSGKLFHFDPQTGVSDAVVLQSMRMGTKTILNDQPGLSCLTSDEAGNLWLAPLAVPGNKNNVVIKYNAATGEQIGYSLPNIDSGSTIDAIKLDNRGRMWVEDEERLYRFDETNQQFQELPGLEFNLRISESDPHKSLFWGTYSKGLAHVDLDKGICDSIQLHPELRQYRAVLWHQGFLWLASNRGLVKVDPNTYKIRTFDRGQGLPGDFVYSMVADGNHLWLGTSDGLCRFDIQTEGVKNFYMKDGLPHNEFNSYSVLKAKDGRLYMGTLNGVIAFYPEDLEDKQSEELRVLWSEFSYFDARGDSLHILKYGQLDTSRSLKLLPSVQNFTIKLALNSFADPAKNKYVWRMDGLDKSWNYAGNHPFAIYNQLPPGDYVFRAKGSDPYGNWSANELAIPITILRPWYSRWWAWLFYLALTGGLIYAGYRFQLSRKLSQAENLRLRELDTFKSRFFANITHEFRTPLTVILGASEQLESKVDQEARSTVSLIRRNGDNLLRLINQILDLAKLENKSLEMNYVQGDVLAYLRYVAESLHSLANVRNVMIRVESNETTIIMDYDPDRLLYIAHNLLSNAIKFTPSGGKVTMRVDRAIGENALGEEEVLSIQVIDSGIGIPSEDLPKIFDRFFQARNQEYAQTGGSGIGLSLTRELVKAMDGEIFVKSELGKGTTFSVLLPVRNQAQPTLPGAKDAPVAPLEKTVVQKAAGLQPTSIPAAVAGAELLPELLLIEDNPDVVEYLAACLSGRYRLHFAYNGRSGIEQAFELAPDIIISDVMMPEKDGFAVVESLKNDERTSHIPIVLLTARAEIESRIAGLRRGADAYLAKPFHREELEVTLEKLLENRRRLQERYRRLPMAVQALPPPDDTAVKEDEFLLRLKSFFETNYAKSELSLDDACREMNMGRSNLNRKVQALTSQSPMQLLRQLRLYKARDLFNTTEMNVSEVAFEVGFNDPKYFSRAFSEEFGVPPSKFIEKK